MLRVCAAVALSLPLLTGLASCDTDDGWYPYPPSGWDNNFWDSRLDGYWVLTGINGYTVTGSDVNYMFFNGSGRGLYYYMLDYRRYVEQTRYWCQPAVNGNSYYQINIQYQDGGTPSTMNYWFSDGGRFLNFQWVNQSGLQTYVYSRYPGAPW